MTKQFTLVIALFSLLSVGCGKSACEEGYDIALECGDVTPDQKDFQIAICEALPEDEFKACLDCTNEAADPCTASDTGGPCEAVCNFTL